MLPPSVPAGRPAASATTPAGRARPAAAAPAQTQFRDMRRQDNYEAKQMTKMVTFDVFLEVKHHSYFPLTCIIPIL